MEHAAMFTFAMATGKIKLLLAGLVLLLNPVLMLAEDPRPSSEIVEREVEGWTVRLDPLLFDEENQELMRKAEIALANHLQRIKFILPERKVTELQQLPIRMDCDHERLDNLQYHPSESWLVKNGYDATLAKHIHIPRASQLLDRRQWAKHPYCIMHELAHAYHDQVLGFDEPKVVAAYEQAKKSGIYDRVLNHAHGNVRHYAMKNHKEYFAESTESYLGVNDFYPFVRAELKQHDPRMYVLMEQIWGEIK